MCNSRVTSCPPARLRAVRHPRRASHRLPKVHGLQRRPLPQAAAHALAARRPRSNLLPSARLRGRHGAVVLGDKDNENLTKHYNDGHVADLVEVGAGFGGKDRIKEIKVFSPLKQTARSELR